MKFKCYKCREETTFNKEDYVGTGKKQQIEPVIKFMNDSSSLPMARTKEIIVKCSNTECKEPNKLTIKCYE